MYSVTHTHTVAVLGQLFTNASLGGLVFDKTKSGDDDADDEGETVKGR